jgi:hypothetical protein
MSDSCGPDSALQQSPVNLHIFLDHALGRVTLAGTLIGAIGVGQTQLPIAMQERERISE